MSVVSEKAQRRLHDIGHDEEPWVYDFDFWCVAHGERKGCHSGLSDGSCDPYCADCPVRCPWCEKAAALKDPRP